MPRLLASLTVAAAVVLVALVLPARSGRTIAATPEPRPDTFIPTVVATPAPRPDAYIPTVLPTPEPRPDGGVMTATPCAGGERMGC